MSDQNERIAVWMDNERNENGGIHDYRNNEKAALGVLERMADKCDCLMRPSYGRWIVFIQRATHPHGHFERDTPCAAICAAWEAEFGGEV